MNKREIGCWMMDDDDYFMEYTMKHLSELFGWSPDEASIPSNIRFEQFSIVREPSWHWNQYDSFF